MESNVTIDWQFVWSVVGSAGVGSAVTFGLFKYFAKSWMDNKFAERLASFKHNQDVEIQRLRVEIDSALNGAIRVQEKEFDVLTDAWGNLEEAVGWLGGLITPIQSYVDLNRMTDDELEEFLEQTELTNTQKEKIRHAKDKVRLYIDEIHWHRVHRVKKKISEYNILVARLGIFFPDEIHGKLTTMGSQLREHLSGYEVAVESKEHKMRGDVWRKFESETQPLLKEIEALIRSRLRSYGTLSENRD
ncbi:MAG: hypothetical protein KAH11_07085 [Rhodospirillales bacterium]|nr:hypothetical protein [Rhodospirillales bacterium]